ncbi:M20/M25/M40 family metallo-hydrolase [Rugosimonospora africana]|uniref:Peptidase M20 n=1 Tax=Rugosimonospora africana TaxID=556532 RepID=A0A8J3QKT6_9ACTN|nr:M20/M25/M40 family metallo-hydrolase [Rugosimonospora africana]GIH11927.1 peptidase M20 [Rugosimonospora africana]
MDVTETAGMRDTVYGRQGELLDLLIDYLRQPSVSATGEGFPAATQRAMRELELAGLRAEVWETAGRPCVFGRADGPPGAPTVLIYGHYDVQPVGPSDLWRTTPFEPVIDAGRIWARGSGDNKGQHYAHLQAVRLLREARGGLPVTVKIILDGEEEVGSPNLEELVSRQRDALAADVVIYSDGPVDNSGQWCVKHGVRGVLGIGLHVRYADRAVHSGNFGNVVPNPAWTLVRALASMRDDDGKVLIDGFYDDVVPLGEADREALRGLPPDDSTLADFGVAEMDPAYGDLSFQERLAALPTLTINGLHSGDPQRTIIPHEARARIDIRLVDGQRPEAVLERVRAHLARHAPDVVMTQEMGVPPARTPIDNPFTPRIARAMAAVTGQPPLLVPAMGGTLPVYVWNQVLGVPALGIPFANVDENNHGPNENLEVSRYLDGIAISMAVLSELAGTVAR